MEFRCSIRQLIRLSLAVGLLAAFLAPGLAQAQGPPGSHGVWQTFTTANSGLRHNYVWALLEDRAGGLWVGTYGGGVSRYFQGTWQTFSTESGSLGSNYVSDMSELLEDQAGGVWVGTGGSGVSYHRPGSYQPWVLLRQLEVEREGRTQSYDLSGGDVPGVPLDFPVERLTIRFVGADLDSRPDNIRYFYQLERWDARRRPTAERVGQPRRRVIQPGWLAGCGNN